MKKINFTKLKRILREEINKEVDRVTPEMLTNLKPNEIFVFGSNLQGHHAGGAARFALVKFGAKWGQGVGLQGQSYAIPTLNFAAVKGTSLDDLKLPVNEIGDYVDEFINFAKSHPDMYFYVTPIGCGIAGFTENEMALLFQDAMNIDNIALPQCFWDVLT